jgi:hypothetical protein
LSWKKIPQKLPSYLQCLRWHCQRYFI